MTTACANRRIARLGHTRPGRIPTERTVLLRTGSSVWLKGAALGMLITLAAVPARPAIRGSAGGIRAYSRDGSSIGEPFRIQGARVAARTEDPSVFPAPFDGSSFAMDGKVIFVNRKAMGGRTTVLLVNGEGEYTYRLE